LLREKKGKGPISYEGKSGFRRVKRLIVTFFPQGSFLERGRKKGGKEEDVNLNMPPYRLCPRKKENGRRGVGTHLPFLPLYKFARERKKKKTAQLLL